MHTARRISKYSDRMRPPNYVHLNKLQGSDNLMGGCVCLCSVELVESRSNFSFQVSFNFLIILASTAEIPRDLRSCGVICTIITACARVTSSFCTIVE